MQDNTFLINILIKLKTAYFSVEDNSREYRRGEGVDATDCEVKISPDMVNPVS